MPKSGRRQLDHQAPAKPAAMAFSQLSRDKNAKSPITVRRAGGPLAEQLDLTHI